MSSIKIDKTVTREAWLRTAVSVFRKRFVEIEYPLPENIHVSVGFGTGIRGENKIILGATWATWMSDDSVNHVFISPALEDPSEVLRILLHELVHVCLDNADGHTGRFAEIATLLGFEAPMTSTPTGVQLAAELHVLAAELGTYPHGKLDIDKTITNVPVGPDGKPIPGQTGPKAQQNRHLKLMCPKHPKFSVRISRAVANEFGMPSCPCGTDLEWA